MVHQSKILQQTDKQQMFLWCVISFSNVLEISGQIWHVQSIFGPSLKFVYQKNE